MVTVTSQQFDEIWAKKAAIIAAIKAWGYASDDLFYIDVDEDEGQVWMKDDANNWKFTVQYASNEHRPWGWHESYGEEFFLLHDDQYGTDWINSDKPERLYRFLSCVGSSFAHDKDGFPEPYYPGFFPISSKQNFYFVKPDESFFFHCVKILGVDLSSISAQEQVKDFADPTGESYKPVEEW